MPAAACDNRSVPTESLSREQACENDSLFKSSLQALVSNSRALLGASYLGILMVIVLALAGSIK
jgi:hypothetical protein